MNSELQQLRAPGNGRNRAIHCIQYDLNDASGTNLRFYLDGAIHWFMRSDYSTGWVPILWQLELVALFTTAKPSCKVELKPGYEQTILCAKRGI